MPARLKTLSVISLGNGFQIFSTKLQKYLATIDVHTNTQLSLVVFHTGSPGDPFDPGGPGGPTGPTSPCKVRNHC